MDRLGRIQELRDAYESVLDDAERLRDEYHREIVKLHRSGVSLRDIAESLGISHQRVHQIVAPLETPRARKLRRAAVGGAIAALALIVGIGSANLVSRGWNSPDYRATPSTERTTRGTDAISGFCAIAASPASSRFTPSSLAARCGADMLRSGAVVAIDPDTGEVLAISGVTSTQTLERALSTISTCGHAGTTDVLMLGVDCPSGSAPNAPSLGQDGEGGRCFLRDAPGIGSPQPGRASFAAGLTLA